MCKENQKAKYKSRLKIRETALGFTVFMTLALAIIVPQTASAISLKHNSLVETDVITLGDVFSGLERKSERVLGPAPRPGHDMVLNARTLMRIAIAMDLPWRPASTADQVVLSRAATIVSPTMIKDSLKNEISARGLSGSFDIAIASGVHDLVLPFDADKSVEVESLSFDGDKNSFKAVLVAPSSDNPVVREKVNGIVHRMVDVPVLRSPMKTGNIIRAHDLDSVAVRSEFIQHDMILSQDELVGMTPRRLILAGNPIKEMEVQEPQIVKRGELVTMVFKSGGLSLTAQGKALENGARGDMIRVVNASSSRTLEAVVSGYKEVNVESF